MDLHDAIVELPLHGNQGGRELVLHPSAVATARGLVLLDVGLPGQLDALREALDEADWSLGNVTAIVLTHQDPDHVGGLADAVEAIRRANGRRPTIYAHTEAAPFIDGRRDPIKTDGGRYPAVDVDVELTDGTTFHTEAGPMRLLHTPGHTPGHLSAYFPDERTLLSGDALTVGEDVAGPPEDMSLDMAEATRSVGRLADLQVRQLGAYHGGPIETDGDRIEAVYEELAAAHDVS